MTEAARRPAPPPATRRHLVGIVLGLLGLRVLGFVLLAFLIVSTALLVIWLGLPLLLMFLASRSPSTPSGGSPAAAPPWPPS